MEAISGVFTSRSAAESAVGAISKAGIPHDRVTLLTPGSSDAVSRELRDIHTDAAEQPGMGKAVGALMGGGVGVTGGALLMALVPGVGVISALGLLGAAVLGAAGATVGGAVGNRAENALAQGLPEDEIFVYEDALRKGRTVVIALAGRDDSAEKIRNILQTVGAESVDAARDQWWIGLRNAEEAHYSKDGKNFSGDERFYRMGFEAALHARTRCMEFDQVTAEMDAHLEDVKRQYPGQNVEEPFLRGYQRGREHYQELCGGKKAA